MVGLEYLYYTTNDMCFYLKVYVGALICIHKFNFWQMTAAYPRDSDGTSASKPKSRDITSIGGRTFTDSAATALERIWKVGVE